MLQQWRWWIWGGYVCAWTAALTGPVPEHPLPLTYEYDRLVKFIFAKTLHAGAYAVLAILSGWLRVPVRYRPLLVFAIVAHGTATELIQKYVVARDGTLRDVMIDNAGILIGMVLSWQWWTTPGDERSRQDGGSAGAA